MIDDTNKFYKIISAKDYFADVVIPDTWASLEEFTQWYMDQRMPMMIPWDAQVVCSDDATAICVFRKAPYQVELYLVHPQQFVPRHSHPGTEVMTMFLAGGRTSPCTEASAHNMGRAWGQLGHKIGDGEYHGGSQRPIDKDGFGLLAFQKWPEGVDPKTAAIQWKGDTAGPKQEKLIKEAHPNGFVTPGFADISRTTE